MVEISPDIPAAICSAAWVNPLPSTEGSVPPQNAEVRQFVWENLWSNETDSVFSADGFVSFIVPTPGRRLAVVPPACGSKERIYEAKCFAILRRFILKDSVASP